MGAFSRERLGGFSRRAVAGRTEGNEALSEYFSAVLEYHFTPIEEDDYFREAPPNPEEAQELGLISTLRQAFWHVVFEDEHAASRILAKARRGRVLLLRGLRGTGKTTALHHLIRHVASLEDNVLDGADLHYFDILGLRYQLDDDSQGGRNDLCSFVAQELVGEYLTEDPDSKQWKLYQISRVPSFQPIRDRLQKRRTPTPEWVDVVESDRDLDQMFDTCADTFALAKGETRLFHVLTHLASLGQPICLILDNLDQMPATFQVKVGEHLARLTRGGVGPLYAAIAALRPENVANVLEQLDGTEVDLVEFDLEDSVPSRSSVDGERLARIAERRLDFLRRYPIDAFYDEPHLRRSMQLRRFGTTTKLREHLAELNHYVRVVLTDDHQMSQALYYWHNGSVRHSLLSAASVVEAALLDQPDVMGLSEAEIFADLLRRGGTGPADRRARSGIRVGRSILYRHLLFSEYASDRVSTGPPVSLLLVQPAYSNGTCPFPDLMALTCVDQAGGSVSLDQLEEELFSMGLPRDETSLAVARLSARRVRDAEGFLRRVPGEDPQVELTLAGRFLRQRLLRTCEFMFWNAVATYEPQDLEPMGSQADAFGDEAYRIEVVQRFLEESVVPVLTDYKRWLDSDRHSRGSRTVNQLLTVVIDGFISFVATSDTHRDQVKQRSEALMALVDAP